MNYRYKWNSEQESFWNKAQENYSQCYSVQGFISEIPNDHAITKSKIDKTNHIKIKNSYLSKDTKKKG